MRNCLSVVNLTAPKSIRMKWNFKMVLSLLLLECMSYCSCVIHGEIDENCTISECICCFSNHCGPGTYFPDECLSGCIDGHRGLRCTRFCINDCKACPNSADECSSCYDDFYSVQNECKKCPANCKTCSSSTYCTSCKEGFQHSTGSQTCDHQICPANCECNQGDCIACKKGYYNTTVNCNNTCPINCVSCLSSEECLECREGYYNGYGLYGDSRILLNNCTHKCLNTCVNCSSDNKCLQCPVGKHGLQCQYKCSGGCNDNICLIETGMCDCSTNFSGERCTDCIVGRFGGNCEQDCPVNCKNYMCDKSKGHCIEGCIRNNIIGDKCNECVVGVHGALCDKPCPENCKGRMCGKENGLCTNGCNGNFNGSTCANCIKGKYGSKCNLDCPRKCADYVCDKETGSCSRCVASFIGEKCNQCITGFHGEDCDKKCSPNCFNAICGKNDGICEFGCRAGYSGDKCCLDNQNCLHCTSNTECRECTIGYFQTRCEDKCPVNCLGSCDSSTGFCSECTIDKFSLLCDFTCSENCNNSNCRGTSKCASHDGTCTFGCKDGFFGRTCNETCKSFCIDRVCRQENGKCLKGCRGSKNDPACEHESQDVSAVNSQILVVTFATLFALTTTILCILIVMKVVKKIRSPQKKSQESEFQVNFESSLAGSQNSQNQSENVTVDPVDEIVTYEIIDRTKDSQEHVYEAPNQNRTDRPENYGNKQYENLKL